MLTLKTQSAGMVLGSQYNNSLQEEENTWEESNNKNRVQNFYYICKTMSQTICIRVSL